MSGRQRERPRTIADFRGYGQAMPAPAASPMVSHGDGAERWEGRWSRPPDPSRSLFVIASRQNGPRTAAHPGPSLRPVLEYTWIDGNGTYGFTKKYLVFPLVPIGLILISRHNS